jgi:hypothetical protein
VNAIGEVEFYERHLENELWKEVTVTYQIEETDQVIGEDMASPIKSLQQII